VAVSLPLPTRRSSDLFRYLQHAPPQQHFVGDRAGDGELHARSAILVGRFGRDALGQPRDLVNVQAVSCERLGNTRQLGGGNSSRSEEHTSELQSREYL